MQQPDAIFVQLLLNYYYAKLSKLLLLTSVSIKYKVEGSQEKYLPIHRAALSFFLFFLYVRKVLWELQ